MRFLVLGILATCLVAGEAAPAAAKPLLIAVTPDHATAFYQVGETARFRIALTQEGIPVVGRALTWSVARDGAATLSGTSVSTEAPFEVEATLDRPGFALCRVAAADDGKLVGFGGAGFSVELIRPASEAPVDFHAFWQRHLAALAALPMNARLTPVAAQEATTSEAFDLRVDCLGGKPVSGYYSRPLGAAKGSCPAYVSFHGAGVRSASMTIGRAQNGFIALDINAHGIENGKDADFYSGLAQGELKGYQNFSRNDRDQCYFLGMFLRVARAVQFLKAQPEWDGRTVVAQGSSQGGWQSLVAAGLDPQVTMCVAYVPAGCDQLGVLHGRRGTWPYYLQVKDGVLADPATAASASYFDAAWFARDITAETVVLVGGIDITCTPSSIYAMYSQIPGPKSILLFPGIGHAVPAEMVTPANQRIEAHRRR